MEIIEENKNAIYTFIIAENHDYKTKEIAALFSLDGTCDAYALLDRQEKADQGDEENIGGAALKKFTDLKVTPNKLMIVLSTHGAEPKIKKQELDKLDPFRTAIFVDTGASFVKITDGIKKIYRTNHIPLPELIIAITACYGGTILEYLLHKIDEFPRLIIYSSASSNSMSPSFPSILFPKAPQYFFLGRLVNIMIKGKSARMGMKKFNSQTKLHEIIQFKGHEFHTGDEKDKQKFRFKFNITLPKTNEILDILFNKEENELTAEERETIQNIFLLIFDDIFKKSELEISNKNAQILKKSLDTVISKNKREVEKWFVKTKINIDDLLGYYFSLARMTTALNQRERTFMRRCAFYCEFYSEEFFIHGGSKNIQKQLRKALKKYNSKSLIEVTKTELLSELLAGYLIGKYYKYYAYGFQNSPSYLSYNRDAEATKEMKIFCHGKQTDNLRDAIATLIYSLQKSKNFGFLDKFLQLSINDIENTCGVKFTQRAVSNCFFMRELDNMFEKINKEEKGISKDVNKSEYIIRKGAFLGYTDAILREGKTINLLNWRVLCATLEQNTKLSISDKVKTAYRILDICMKDIEIYRKPIAQKQIVDSIREFDNTNIDAKLDELATKVRGRLDGQFRNNLQIAISLCLLFCILVTNALLHNTKQVKQVL